ncbi:MAG: hypothetical protein GX447_01165 [Elusimicrobia bacterium]|nr:hypothetical protein [Elusimicrobiota bacterium]
MIKFLSGVVFLFSSFSFAVSFEDQRASNDLEAPSFSENFAHIPSPQSFSADSGLKYNQQNTALRKIKVNEIQPDMDNTVILNLEKGDIDFYLNDLRKDGFKVEAYDNASGFYFIMADLTGKNVASEALGLAKYYYVKEVLVSKKTYSELFGLKSKVSYAVRIGSITGGMNRSPVDLTLNKISWTIKGGMNRSPIDLVINHQEKTIKGGANLSPVDLKFDWSSEEVRVYGGANLSPVDYTVNWKGGMLKGYSNNSPLEVKFDMKESVAGDNIVELKGYANHAPVELTFDKISGELKGGMNYSPVDVKFVNCDLYDFLQYFFVFLNIQQ